MKTNQNIFWTLQQNHPDKSRLPWKNWGCLRFGSLEIQKLFRVVGSCFQAWGTFARLAQQARSSSGLWRSLSLRPRSRVRRRGPGAWGEGWLVKRSNKWTKMWGFPKIVGVSPQNGWFIMENPIKMGWFEGGTLFLEISICFFLIKGKLMFFFWWKM